MVRVKVDFQRLKGEHHAWNYFLRSRIHLHQKILRKSEQVFIWQPQLALMEQTGPLPSSELLTKCPSLSAAIRDTEKYLNKSTTKIVMAFETLESQEQLEEPVLSHLMWSKAKDTNSTEE